MSKITDSTDTKIETLGNEVSQASVTCSAAEVSSLSSLSDDLDTLAATVTADLAAVQSLLEEITGSTVDTSSVTSAPAMSTAAAGKRKRNYKVFG